MRKKLGAGLAVAVAAVGLVVVAGPGAPASAIAPGPPSDRYVLRFADEFNGTGIDRTRWNFRTDEKAFSKQLERNVSVVNGRMRIHMRQENVGGYRFTTGGIISKEKFRYGYYETRMRINPSPGWHTSFWLLNGTGGTTFPDYARTEVDIAETDSGPQFAGRVHVGLHRWRGPDNRVYPEPVNYDWYSGLDLTQFHTYGAEWTENQVKFYIDGTLIHTTPYSPTFWTHDYVSIWLTSLGYRSDLAVGPDEFAEFEYVHYYQKDYYVDDDGPASYGYTETGAWAASDVQGWTSGAAITGDPAHGTTTRYATCGVAGSTATWRPTLQVGGTYQVSYYNHVRPNSDPATRLDVRHNGGTATRTVNGTTGSSGWVSLGTHTFAAGDAGFARLTSSGTGCARADAVKFVRVS